MTAFCKQLHLQNGEIIETKEIDHHTHNFLSTFSVEQNEQILLTKNKEFIQILIQLDFKEPQIIQKVENFYKFNIDLHHYVAHDGFVIYLTREKFSEVLEKWNKEKKFIQWIGKVQPHHKTPKETLELFHEEKSIFHVNFKSDCDESCVNEMNQWIGGNGKFKLLTNQLARIEFTSNKEESVKHLLKQEMVEWIQNAPEYKVFNYAGNSVMQHGYYDKPEENRKEIWEQGITGKNEIVTVFDSGLDYDSCYFHEMNKQPPPENSCDQTRTKVIGFFRHEIEGTSTLTILGDHPSGHGTHVTGSVAAKIQGDAPTQLKEYQGAAPDAKIVMVSGGEPNNPAAIQFPPRVSDAFKPQFLCDSKIFTNSWGSANDGYDLKAKEYDQHIYNNDEILVLFAAGNSGPAGKTMGNPAIAKNVLTIGSTQTTPLGRFNSSENFDYQYLTKIAVLQGALSPGQDCCSSSNELVKHFVVN
jgi:hypothetical protein